MRGTVVPFFLRTMVRVRRFFSRLMNRNFMVFLFFLFLSAAFWVFLALDDEYEREFDVPLELVNVPENVVITTPLPETFHVVLKDRGSQLINYHYAGLPKVTVDFTNYDRHLGMVSFPVTDITKQLVQKMSTSTRLVSANPERLEYLFNFGMHVRMPVRLHATVKAEASYAVSSVRVKPDSVTVWASQEILDTMTAAYTVPVYATSLTASQEREVALQPVRGIKYAPDQVTVNIEVDEMTENEVDVPVRGTNFPASKRLRTFPSKVKVTFQVGTKSYRSITADDFVLLLSYDEVKDNADGRVSLSLKSIPPGVSHVRIVPKVVEFLIEDVPETESDDL